jgi:hypothetical protein
MQFIDDVSLPGHGNITGAFLSLDSRILVVTSAFRRLTEPPARASYGGHRLHYRVALYRPPSRRPIAVFDDARYPIRHVAFHPTRTMLALGAGSYDGGYFFHGQLIVWDWTQTWSKSLRQIPEVVHVRFDESGEDVEATVRPWDDGAGYPQMHDPVDSYYRIFLKGALAREWDKRIDEEVRDQMNTQRPMTGHQIEGIPGIRQPSPSPEVCAARPWQASLLRHCLGWHRTHLEDFADFCRTGKHREHDVFPDMEAADLRSGLETAVAARGSSRSRRCSSADYSVFYGQ